MTPGRAPLKLTDVNYEICVNCRSKRKVIHINHVKSWVPQQTQVYRFVAVAEEMEKVPEKLKLVGNARNKDRDVALKALWEEFKDSLTAELGHTKTAQHSIRTGSATPIWSLPISCVPHLEAAGAG